MDSRTLRSVCYLYLSIHRITYFLICAALVVRIYYYDIHSCAHIFLISVSSFSSLGLTPGCTSFLWPPYILISLLFHCTYWVFLVPHAALPSASYASFLFSSPPIPVSVPFCSSLLSVSSCPAALCLHLTLLSRSSLRLVLPSRGVRL